MGEVLHAIRVFFEQLAAVEFGPLALAICAHLVKTACTSRAWRNVLAAAYPEERVPWISIYGAYLAGVGINAIIPARAGAKVSMRLVPDQKPAEIAAAFQAHVEAHALPGTRVEVLSVHGAEPVLIDARGPIVEAAMDALEAEWGKRPVRVREGGSIPIVGDFQKMLGMESLLVGFGLDDDRVHSPNEKFDLTCYHKGIRSWARILAALNA